MRALASCVVWTVLFRSRFDSGRHHIGVVRSSRCLAGSVEVELEPSSSERPKPASLLSLQRLQQDGKLQVAFDHIRSLQPSRTPLLRPVLFWRGEEGESDDGITV